MVDQVADKEATVTDRLAVMNGLNQPSPIAGFRAFLKGNLCLLMVAAVIPLFPVGCGGSGSTVSSSGSNPPPPSFTANPAHAFQKENGVFLDYGFMVNPMTNSQIQSVVSWMQTRLITYQFLNVSALNADGTMSSSQYTQLANWIAVSRAAAPNQKFIIYISGTLTHVNTPATWPNIAAVCKMFFTTFNVDGVNLDFEPYRTDSVSEANYAGMFGAIRTAVGPSANLSLDYTTDQDYTWSPSVYKQLSSYFNMMMPMVYDSSCTTASCYNTVIDTALEYQYSNLAPGVQFYPILPTYAASDTHTPAVENIASCSAELWNLINASKVSVYGVSVWWHYGWDSTADTDWAAWLAHS